VTVCSTCSTEAPPNARFCASCGAALEGARFPAGEERKLVTIVFVDVTGSTELGEQLDPERLRLLLGRYFAAMSGVIESWGGTVEKYIGDAILAVFGVPVAREDDAVRALHAATEMLDALEGVNAGAGEQHGVRMSVRIGVNTGDIIAPLDARPAGQLLVTGDAVNVAARLQQSAEPGTILVGERTALAARGAFEFTEAARLPVKGKAAPVLARRLLTARRDGSPQPAGLQAAMVGRQRELGALLELLREAIDTGQPRLGVVFGPAGIGKSRMLRELIESASVEWQGLNVLRGRCLSAGHGITFWALGEVLRGSCGIGFDHPADEARRALAACAASTLGVLGLSDDHAERAIHALGLTAGLSMTDGPLAGLEPSAVAEEMARAWPLYMEAHAARAPTALLIEDLHWADPQLLTLVERILGRSNGPLMIVATARPELTEMHPEFVAAREGMTTVTLQPLSETQSGELLDRLLAAADLPSSLRAELLARAEGNPFFLEEMLRRLIDEEALVREDGHWRTTDAAGRVALPDTVHAVIAARIDALPHEEKRTLQEASVLGRTFWEAPLLDPPSGRDVHAALVALERRGLISAHTTSSLAGQTEYAFKHALVRDVAYASVPKARRARAHAEMGAWIEGLAGDRLNEFGELIADHYRTAFAGEAADLAWASDPEARERVRRRAFEALLRAAATARHRYSTKAVELDTEALAVAASDPERAAAHEALGDDHAAFYHGDAALAAYEAALALLPKGDAGRAQVARIVGKVGQAAERFGSFRAGPPAETLERIAQLGLEASGGDDAARARALIFFANLSRSWVGSRMGRLLNQDRRDPVPLANRLAAAEEGLAIAERLGLHDDASMALDSIAELALLQEDPAKYHEVAARQLALVDSVTSPSERADLLFQASRERGEAGAYEEALDLARRTLEVAAELSPHEWMHASYVVMHAAFPLGHWDEALSLLDRHLEVAADEAQVTCTAVNGAPLIPARILVERGEPERAVAFAPLPPAVPERIALPHAAHLLQYATVLDARALAGELVDRMLRMPRAMRSEALPALLEALPALGDWERLDAVLADARLSRDAMAVLAPMVDRAAGLRALEAGDPDAAARLLGSALQGFVALGLPFEAARTREMLAPLLPDEAEALRSAALDVYRRLGIRRQIEVSSPEVTPRT
jgi:class 3 adenylate cyclase